MHMLGRRSYMNFGGLQFSPQADQVGQESNLNLYASETSRFVAIALTITKMQLWLTR